MRVLRRFPGLAGALRDGRLCLSTLSLLGQVLTEENAEELVARMAYRSTAEVDHLVASLRPRPAPVLLETSRPRTVEVRAVSRDLRSLRATVDRSFKDDLETLAMLLGHKLRQGDLAAVLHEAIRCGIEKHGKRRGAVRPARKVAVKRAFMKKYRKGESAIDGGGSRAEREEHAAG